MKLQVIGNVVEDAVLNNVNGNPVINFNIGHIERYKDAQGNRKSRTTIIACSYWADKILLASLLKKGIQLSLEGIPNANIRLSANGSNSAYLTLKVTSIQLLGTLEVDQLDEFNNLLN